MRSLLVALSTFALGVAALLTLSCGSSANSDPNRVLQSITLTPATADAQDYPNGQVQFTATGFYNSVPNTVTPLSAGWGTCSDNAATTAVTVSQAGVAQCASGAVGTYTVWANDYPSTNVGCNAVNACGGGCMVAGSAQLTCP
jgi:hypothetical protein